MADALAGLRVIEVGEGKAIAHTGKLLHDLGAEVVKVEPPGGDALRTYGPFPEDLPHPDHSGLFIYLNAGKRGARLDLERGEDRDALHSLLDGADVLLHSFSPKQAEKMGLPREELLARHSRLIVTAITPYGSTGPSSEWRGYSLQVSAAAGVAARSGDAAREPLPKALEQDDIQHAAVQAAAATVLALVHRNRVGRGQFVDIGMLDALSGAVSAIGLPSLMYQQRTPGPSGRVGRKFGAGPWGVYATKDGDFGVITLLDQQWERFLKIMGDPEWARDEAFRHVQGATRLDVTEQQMSDWMGHLAEWFCQRTNAEIWRLTRDARLPFHPVHQVGEVVDSEQIATRRFMVEVPGPHPQLRVPGAPYRMTETPCLQPAPPPALDDVPASSWGGQPLPDPEAALGVPDGDSHLPLEGIRVIDLTQVRAGPVLARYLADYGADVIVVDTDSRPRSSYVVADSDSPLQWESLYRNRRSVHLNLRTPDALILFKRLLKTADLLIDNFSPRVMPNFGLSYEQLSAENPQLIIAALSAAGRSGPWVDLLSYGPSLTALYGSKSLHGYPPDEVMEDGADLDPISSSYAMLVIMAAINHRDRTGRGQMIEIAQGELALCGVAEAVIEYVWNGRNMSPQGSLNRMLAPNGMYACAGEDRWIAISCGAEDEWRALVHSADHPQWLTDERFSTAADRRGHRIDLDQAISAWTRGHEAEALATYLQEAGVAAHPVVTTAELLADPHIVHRRQHFRLNERFEPDQLYYGNPWHLSLARPLLRYPAPVPGEHSEEIFSSLLGLSSEEVKRYQRDGVIA